jgi:hypothetical protein
MFTYNKMSKKNIWVIFDGYGIMVFRTFEQRYANLNLLTEAYNLSKCSIALNPCGYKGDPQGRDGHDIFYQKNMTTGTVSIITIEEFIEQVVYPHIPCPNDPKSWF